MWWWRGQGSHVGNFASSHKSSFHIITKYLLWATRYLMRTTNLVFIIFWSIPFSFLTLRATYPYKVLFGGLLASISMFLYHDKAHIHWLTKYSMVATRIEGTKNILGMTKKRCFFYWKHFNFPAKIHFLGRQRPLVRRKALY